MSAAATSFPTGIIPRFSLFIEVVKRAMGEGIGRRHDTLGPLAILLWNYLSATLRRLAALHARFAAGKLPAPRARRPAAVRATADRPRPERRPPGIPRGPVLLTVFRAPLSGQLQTLLDDPEIRALLAASPQAGRLLRPLWRKLTTYPLPEVLRLTPKPRQPKSPRPARPKPARAAPAPRAASRYPVSLWPDPAPAAKPAPPLPAWPPPLWPD